jgi:hypothetical protein
MNDNRLEGGTVMNSTNAQARLYDLYFGSFRSELINWIIQTMPADDPRFWIDYVLPALSYGNNRKPRAAKRLEELDLPDLIKVIIHRRELKGQLPEGIWTRFHLLLEVRNEICHRGGMQPFDGILDNVNAVLKIVKGLGLSEVLQGELKTLRRDVLICLFAEQYVNGNRRVDVRPILQN